MSTEHSLDFREQMNASASELVPVYLITLTNPATDEIVRLSSDRSTALSYDPFVQGTRSRGHEFVWLPMSLVEPAEGEDVLPFFRINLLYLDEQLLDAARDLPAARTAVKIELVSSTEPDHPEELYDHFKLLSTPWDSTVVTLLIGLRDDAPEYYPHQSLNPQNAPGMHR